MALNNHFTTGHFHLVIDGASVTSFIKSVEGGLVGAQSVEEPVGQYNLRGRHLGTREIEPVQIEFGMAGATWALAIAEQFISQRKIKRLDGEIVHADANMVEQYRQEFVRGLLTEITLPKLDASSKDTAMIKVKLQPEHVKFKLGAGPKIKSDSFPSRQKAWHTSNFRITFDNGVDAKYVNSIEALTIKMGVKTMQQGNQFSPDVVPTKVDMPKLSITLPLLRAGGFIKWYEKAVANQEDNGTPDSQELGISKGGGSSYETSVGIEYLDQTTKDTLYTVTLMGVGLEKFSIPKSEANGAGTKMAKFDFYVTDMKVEANGSGFK